MLGLFNHVSVGIDIGHHSIKIVELTRFGGKTFVTGVAKILKGDDADAANVSYKLYSRLKETKIRTNSAVLNVPQDSAILQYMHVPQIPLWRLKTMMDMEMSDMAEKAGGNVTTDFQMLELPDHDEICTMIGLARDSELYEHFQMATQAKISVRNCTPCPLALFQSYVSSNPAALQETSMLVNIGHAYTDLVIQGNGKLYFARSVSMGSKHFTQAIADTLSLSAEQAEALKLEKATLENASFTGNDDSVDGMISGAVSAQAGQFVNMLRSTFNICQVQTKIKRLSMDKIYLCGGGAALPGLRAYLEANLQKKVEFFSPFEHMLMKGISADGVKLLRQVPSDLTTAVGLAQLGFHDKKSCLTLLPREIRKKREFMQKNIFMYMGSAVAVLFLLAAWLISGMDLSARDREKTAARNISSGLESNRASFNQMTERNQGYLDKIRLLESRVNRGQSDLPHLFFRSLLDLLAANPAIEMTNIEFNMTPVGRDDNTDRLYYPEYILEGSARSSETEDGATRSGFDNVSHFMKALQALDSTASLVSEKTPTMDVNLSLFKFRVKVKKPE